MDKDRWIRQFNSIQQRREEHATRHEKLGTVHTRKKKKKTSDKYEYEKTERRRNFIKKKKKEDKKYP